MNANQATGTGEKKESAPKEQRKVEMRLEQLIIKLRRRQICGSFNVAKATGELLREVISVLRWTTVRQLMDLVVTTGRKISRAEPMELSAGNLVRRVLLLIREEYASLLKQELQQPLASVPVSSRGVAVATTGGAPAAVVAHSRPELRSSTSLLASVDGSSSSSSSGSAMEQVLSAAEVCDYDRVLANPKDFKTNVLSAIAELIDELNNLYRNIAEQAVEHIHANEVIMTHGHSRTVCEFLKAAAHKGRKFEVIVPESAPGYQGRRLAKQLAAASIETTLISDAAIFAMMARCNKVIISTHAVMANGGLIALTGTHNLALAAKAHSVPLVCCTGLYKLSPQYRYDKEGFNDHSSPGSIMKFEEAESYEYVHVESPAYDYIPPDLVDLFVTNFGGHHSSYIYRLLSELYSPDDNIDDDHNQT